MIKFFTSCGQKILQAFHCFEEYFPGKQLCSNYLQTLKLRASNFIETNFNSSGSKNPGSFNQFWLVFSENHLMNIWRICFRYDDTMIVKRTNRQSKNNNNLLLKLAVNLETNIRILLQLMQILRTLCFVTCGSSARQGSISWNEQLLYPTKKNLQELMSKLKYKK